MKHIFLLLLTISMFSCKNETKKETVKAETTAEETAAPTKNYPEALVKVFDAHGGLETWNSMQSLAYTQVKDDGNVSTITNLKNRNIVVDMPDHTIGANSNDIWLNSKNDKAFKGNPRFFYNLMFYFYAMPFVLADDGIIYSDAESITFEGVTYPGIKISYENGVGESSGDDYVLYYNPTTYKMAWLGYTVTYFSKEKSSELHFRRYTDWQTVNGLELVESMEGFTTENNAPGKSKRKDVFTDVKLSQTAPDNAIFETPETAEIAK
ncbi:DUF6503 family protein [Algibacter miyuki]|uniref:DUF6503 family protein n=1 Tax=Algibacter miyuki TaxID=1306933 RepID=A0ABV5H3Z9_9FLAO|nr:DUF6503 family protein [Algibacter miyuki]MDN3665686.1 hypothetical protein [Algibacter miyuki]